MYITNTNHSYSATATQTVNPVDVIAASSSTPYDEAGEAACLIDYLDELIANVTKSGKMDPNSQAEITRVLDLLKDILPDVGKAAPDIAALISATLYIFRYPPSLANATVFQTWCATKQVPSGMTPASIILTWLETVQVPGSAQPGFWPSPTAGPDVIFACLTFANLFPTLAEKLFGQGGSVDDFATLAADFLCAYVATSPDKAALGALLSSLLVEDPQRPPGSTPYDKFVEFFKSNWKTWTPPSRFSSAQAAEAYYLQQLQQYFNPKN